MEQTWKEKTDSGHSERRVCDADHTQAALEKIPYLPRKIYLHKPCRELLTC